jgi:branched-chain amino acid transport system substrate-binding protein
MSTTQWTEDAKWPGAREWGERYKKVFGKEATYHAACAYASLMVMGEVAKAANGDRQKIRDGLDTGKWSTILGDIQFQDYEGFTNQNKHEMLVIQVQKGKFVTIAPPQFAAGKAVYPFPGWK